MSMNFSFVGSRYLKPVGMDVRKIPCPVDVVHRCAG